MNRDIEKEVMERIILNKRNKGEEVVLYCTILYCSVLSCIL